jgi:hypothetical protein
LRWIPCFQHLGKKKSVEAMMSAHNAIEGETHSLNPPPPHAVQYNVPLVRLFLRLGAHLAARADALAKQVHGQYLPYLEHFEPDVDADATKRSIDLRNEDFNADGFVVAW